MIETPDAIRTMKPGVRETLEELDRRGILLSIASKNNLAEARAKLQAFGILDLFLCPQVSWGRKSESIRRIVAHLNIGLDSVAFIDDSAFERAEVGNSLPKVRVFDETEFVNLTGMPAFDVPVTEDSRRRRQLYRAEEGREAARTETGADYDAFLRTCDIRLQLEPVSAENRLRVEELVQRTNQLNFSGTHYTRDELGAALEEPGVEPVVMRAADRFGDYGIVGFAILGREPGELVIRDMMISCRVQGKKIDQAFLGWAVEAAQREERRVVRCVYRQTDRNKPALAVLQLAGFRKASSEGAFELEVESWQRPDLPVRMEVGSGEDKAVREGRKGEGMRDESPKGGGGAGC